MQTKVKFIVTPPEQGSPDLVSINTLSDGDWFSFVGREKALGVIVDGKPFYPLWLTSSYRANMLVTAIEPETKVRVVKNLIIQEKCRG